jgi:hypothetical protein
MQKQIFMLPGLFLIRVNGKAFSLLLPPGLGEYFKILSARNSPEPTTTIKSEQFEHESYLLEFSIVELRTVRRPGQYCKKPTFPKINKH